MSALESEGVGRLNLAVYHLSEAVRCIAAASLAGEWAKASPHWDAANNHLEASRLFQRTAVMSPTAPAPTQAKRPSDAPQTKPKHTPGPWTVTSSRGDVHSVFRVGQGWVCQGPNDCVSATPESEREANAQLIAAAPDLLAALQRLLDASERHIFGDECRREREGAEAAIARATGAAA